jgi:hypothetical protein
MWYFGVGGVNGTIYRANNEVTDKVDWVVHGK